MHFLFYAFCSFICLGCSVFQSTESQEEYPLSIESRILQDISYTDDKITLQLKNATPEQIDLFTTKYKNFSAETYIFFQPHISQIVLDGQNPNWVPHSEGRYCIEKAIEQNISNKESQSELAVKEALSNTKHETKDMTTKIVLKYANHCKKNSILLSEFTSVLKTFVHPENSCDLVCGCAIRQGEMLTKHTSIAQGNHSECVKSCISIKNTCLESCATTKNHIARSQCEDHCRDISQSSFCDTKVSCCSLHL